MKSTQFNFRVSPDLRKRIAREAKKLRVSDAQFVRRVLTNHLDALDYRRSQTA
jgi:predicted HicB family RNase H-like nuclease